MAYGRRHLKERRDFLKYSTAFLAASPLLESELDAYPKNVNTNSKPSDLKITDLRVAVVVKPGPSPCPLIRIDTNQGVSGLGEVRDGAILLRRGKKNYLVIKIVP